MKNFLLLICSLFCVFTGLNAQISVSGEITSNTTWTKNNTYQLSGFVYVKNGATLTIEAGTTIKGDKTSKATLIVTRGSKINAIGTADEPIVFTSNESTPSYGDWGGIIILGKAPVNTVTNGTAGEGIIEGGVDNAAGDGRYGGTDAADNSGILRYVRIEYPGIAFQPNNEINGLTMGGVGNGTVIDYVQVSYSGDDSFEWFGGTVDAKHLIAYRGLDDDFDTDFGYQGNIQFAFSVRDPQVADIGNASNGFESDNDATGTENGPKTRPTFSNVTVVGPSGSILPDYKRAAHLRRSTELGLFNSVMIGSYPVGLFIDGTATEGNATSGKLEVKNTYIAGPTELLKSSSAFDINAWYGTAGWGNNKSANASDAKLKDPFNIDLPNARPEATSPVIGASAWTAARVNTSFFTKVNYIGAFGPSGDWTCGWAKYKTPGCTPNENVIVTGNITTNTTWTAGNTYLLQGFVYVKNCATLTIEPGTIIKGDKGSKATLIVTRCAKIVADGTVDKPIIFTSSNEVDPTYGDWGGIIILGKAPVNTVTNGTAGEGIIEGGVDNAAGDGRYGGTDVADNSGIMRYVRIEYPGIAFQPNNEINGLTMGGVGNGTLIDYVQVSYSGDDSFEWFGGTVDAKHLIAYRGLDDDFDTDFGYQGNIQFAFSVRDPQVADIGNASNGFESDNDATGSENGPKTRPTFSNVTVVGPSGGSILPDYKRAAHLRRSTELGLFNSVMMGSYPVGLFIDGTATEGNATAGKLEVKNTYIAGPTELLKSSSAFDINAWYGTAGWGNNKSANATDVKLKDPFNIDLPNARPDATSPVIGASAWTAARVNTSFFTKVNYIGAFGPSGDWTCGWAKYKTAGCTPNENVVVTGNITTNTTWSAGNTYVLQGFVYVKECATLTIEPGTIIKGDKGTKATLIVTRCSKIIADGTLDKPIVFTSSNDVDPTYGDWGGIILLGKAPVNTVTNGTAGEGIIEGGVDNAAGDGRYGGTDAADNSGILRYVRIEYPGIAFQPNNEINGLTMGGVGNGTVIDNVQVAYSGDDSFEWFGGTVNAKHLIAYRGLDDDFDTDFGYQGNVQFALAVRDPQVADIGNASNGFESDNDATGSENTPKTRPTFSNVTVVGPSGASTLPDYKRAAHLRRSTEIGIFNSLFVGSYPVGLFIDGTATEGNATANKLEIKNTWFAGQTELLKATAAFDISTWFSTAAWKNGKAATSDAAALQNPFNIDYPNPQPTGLSPAVGVGAASFTSTRLLGGAFSPVTYVGAFDGITDWTCGWAKYKAGLNTACVTNNEEFEKTVASMKLYPTIANDFATLELVVAKASDLNVQIFDISGKYYGTPVSETITEGEHQYRLDTSNLPGGFYFVTVETGNTVKTEKLIIVR
jgi:hypothetical protein